MSHVVCDTIADMKARVVCYLVTLLALGMGSSRTPALEPIPDKLVVLTFDDSVASQYSVVRPILKRYGFGATFFITEGFSFPTNKRDYMTWEQIRELHQDGFEIGNHTRDHLGVSDRTLGQLREQIEAINARCAEHGIPRPVSFAYPGNAITPGALPILKELGFRFARRGGAPEHPYAWGRGFAYEPGLDHPLLIPSAGDARPDWTLDDFKRGVDQARAGRIAVMQFHGVPDNEHPWVNSRPERFEEYMRYLKTNDFKVIALRDLARYVDPDRAPADPLAIVEKRKAGRKEVVVEGEVVDAAGGKLLPARVYIRGGDGTWYFPKSASSAGTAIRYERRNGANPNAVEMHTTLSAHPFQIELLPGRYTFTFEHGKEYFPETREVVVERGLPKLTFRLRRWVNMAEEGWFSGDTHNHRDPAELPNTMLAEDVNVALPMVDWTTSSTIAPSASGRGFQGNFGDAPVPIDATHVWNPRNTEYEIFQTGRSNHMLGALLILNHRTRFDEPVLPVGRIAEKARAEGALLDLEKHNWPWSIALVPLLKVDLFELANNHHWETEYAVRNWAVPAPAWMGLSNSGTGTERDWTLYGFQTYYALLNCGFRLRPSAGTANGVHPVPLGFSRVYVHLDEPFTYDAWMRGLAAGRSFVTTGPMVFAKVDDQWPGATFQATNQAKDYRLDCTVRSKQPLETVELIVNGLVTQRFEPQNKKTEVGSFATEITTSFSPKTTSWLAWRCFETRLAGRFRFAHTAPWYFEVTGQPLQPRRVETDWLVARVKEEIARSRGIAPEGLIEDYQRALKMYEKIAAMAR
ncbi:MAG: polysaccharide deacetylase family protein [Verrucomicrobia bacterium]|nr:polysaccharide deacetylase family protein [Verrucomicrobiota bacterium]